MTNYNVLLLTIDCLRYDRCGFNGCTSSPTPFLDSMASESVVWDSAYATGPMTPESVPGILSGLHSYNSAQVNCDVALKSIPDGQATLASWLSKHGYATQAILSNSQLTSNRNYDIGFDGFFNPTVSDDSNSGTNNSDNALKSLIRYCKRQMRNGNRLISPYSLAYILYRWHQSSGSWPTPIASEVIEKTQSVINSLSDPFFVWSHLMDVHGPYHPNITPGIGGVKGLAADCGRARNVRTRWLDESYNATVSYVDSQIRKLVEFLKERGMWENTVMIVTSDHGEALSERGWIGHVARHYLFNELIHVPLLIHHPDIEPTRNQNEVSLAWLSEIIAEALDISEPGFPATGGQRDYFKNNAEDSVAIADGLDEQGHTVAAVGDSMKYISHFSGEWKEHRNQIWHNDGDSYDLCSDPHEMDTIKNHKSQENLATIAHEQLIQSQSLPSINSRISDRAKERLEDIGYTA